MISLYLFGCAFFDYMYTSVLCLGKPGAAGGNDEDDNETNKLMMESLLKEWSAGGAGV